MPISKNINELNRQSWLKKQLSAVPENLRILDAGAGQLKNRIHCKHLEYVSQDFCEYTGGNDLEEGLQTGEWDTSRIDITCDITSIPEPDNSFDVILCTEVFEHIPNPLDALCEFRRLLKKDGTLILTAPFVSNNHFAPYHFCTGFSKYWYEYHLRHMGFTIELLEPNGDWFSLLRQEISRLGSVERKNKSFFWPLGYIYYFLGVLYFSLRPNIADYHLACFGWHCVAKNTDIK